MCPGEDVGGFRLSPLAAFRDLFLSQPQHRLQPLAHAFDALRWGGEAPQLTLEAIGLGPGHVHLAGELTVLLDGGIPVRREHPQLGIQMSQV
ncbi:MAG TPA: hypothetical protein VGH89_32535, partial [Pseudonocardia sp.]